MNDRLRDAAIGWLTTVAEDGQPQSSPVWFLWHEGAVYIATEPDAPKVENVTHNRAAAFHLDGAQPGDLVVTLEGDVEIATAMPSGYAEKYAADLVRLETTADDYLAQFSTTLRFTPTRQRVFPSF